MSASVKAELWSVCRATVFRSVNTIPKYSYEWTSQQVYPKVRACRKCVLVCERSKVMTAEKVRAGLVWTGERGRGSGWVIVCIDVLIVYFVAVYLRMKLRSIVLLRVSACKRDV